MQRTPYKYIVADIRHQSTTVVWLGVRITSLYSTTTNTSPHCFETLVPKEVSMTLGVSIPFVLELFCVSVIESL